MFDPERTIVAIASPTAPAVRGIVRLSGPEVASILESVGIDPPAGTRRVTTRLDVGEMIGVVELDLMYWPTSGSYTGSPSAELHTIGSAPVLTAIVQRLCSAGAKPAIAGEFTLRAFLAGRLDLTQAEAVLGVIDSPGGRSFDAALAQLAGNLSRPLQTIRRDLIELLADIEAGLDFVDEDIEFVTDAGILSRLATARGVMTAAAAQLSARVQSSVVPLVTIRGYPNAGKSCLMNCLSNSNAAIVSATPGTTRDVVRQVALIDDVTLELRDTAGIEADDQHAFAAAANRQSIDSDSLADVRLWCVDWSDRDRDVVVDSVLQARLENTNPASADVLLATKIDLTSDRPPSPWIGCSGVTGVGIDEVCAAIVKQINRPRESMGTAARCQDSLSEAIRAIDAAREAIENAVGQEWVAVEIRTALTAIGEVTGEVYTDDILDQVFSRFCIGK